MRLLEKEILCELQKMEVEFSHQVKKGKVRFTGEARARHLAYLNWVEKLNCDYCSYANGVIAASAEISGRTEHCWRPIKHALRMKSTHSRYWLFFDDGDAERYREQVEGLRRSFEDIVEEDMTEEIAAGKSDSGNPSSSLEKAED